MKIKDKKYSITESIKELEELSEKSEGNMKILYNGMAIGADLMAQKLTK